MKPRPIQFFVYQGKCTNLRKAFPKCRFLHYWKEHTLVLIMEQYSFWTVVKILHYIRTKNYSNHLLYFCGDIVDNCGNFIYPSGVKNVNIIHKIFSWLPL